MPKFRTISGQFVGYVPDGTDPDINPDREPMNGRVTFTPVFTGGVIAFPELSPPEFAHPEPISARIIDGFVQVQVGTDDDVSMQPLSLMVTVDDEASQVWSWRAEFTNMRIGDGEVEVTIPSWSFRVPDGTGPVDLTELVPLKTGGTVDVTKGPRGAGLQSITAQDGQLVFGYTDGEETTIPVPEAVQGPQGEPGPAGADGAEGPEGPQGPPGEIPDLLVGNITDATPTGKNLMLAATEGAARNALGLQAGATAESGSLSDLQDGTGTTAKVWNPRNVADYVTSKTTAVADSINLAQRLHDGTTYPARIEGRTNLFIGPEDPGLAMDPDEDVWSSPDATTLDTVTTAINDSSSLTHAAVQSNYVSRVFLGAAEMGAVDSRAGTLGTFSSSDLVAGVPCWLMSETGVHVAGGVVRIPPGWSGLRAIIYWSHTQASMSGNVNWSARVATLGGGTDLTSLGTYVTSSSTAMGSRIVVEKNMNNVATVPPNGGLVRVTVSRIASSGADTFAASAGLIGIALERMG